MVFRWLILFVAWPLVSNSVPPSEVQGDSSISPLWSWLRRTSCFSPRLSDVVIGSDLRSPSRQVSGSTTVVQRPPRSPRQKTPMAVIPGVIKLVSEAVTGDIPRLIVRFSGRIREFKESFSSFVLDTSGHMNVVFTTAADANRRATVTETVVIHNEDKPVYTLTAPIALIRSERSSLLSDGILAANRKSEFIRAVGSIIFVPPRSPDNSEWGSLVYGQPRLAPYCWRHRVIATEPLIPYTTGEWAIEGSVVLGDLITEPEPITLFIRSSVDEVIVPSDVFFGYMYALERLGYTLDIADYEIMIHDCDQQIMNTNFATLPQIIVNIGSDIKMAIGINAKEFTVKSPATGSCTLGLRPAHAIPGLAYNEAVLGSKFLKQVALQLNHRSGHIALCYRT